MLGFQSPFWLNHSLRIRSPRKADCKHTVDDNPYKWALGHQCLVFNLLSDLSTACELGVQERLIANLVFRPGFMVGGGAQGASAQGPVLLGAPLSTVGPPQGGLGLPG